MRQDHARIRNAEAAARVAQALKDAADPPTIMVRAASFTPLSMAELIPGKRIDNEILQVGDLILLTQQTNASENGVWRIGENAAGLARPPNYVNLPGRQFFVTNGRDARAPRSRAVRARAAGRSWWPPRPLTSGRCCPGRCSATRRRSKPS